MARDLCPTIRAATSSLDFVVATRKHPCASYIDTYFVASLAVICWYWSDSFYVLGGK
jgi:hypothetical protein